jgi:hypothetical protein
MGVHEGTGQLGKALRELLSRWEEAKLAWDDPTTRAFEARYIEPLQAEYKAAAGAMSEMASLLEQVRRECS